MLKIKDNVDLKELEKFGFKAYSFDRNNFYGAVYERFLDDKLVYKVVITTNHKYIQIRDGDFANIAGSLQDLLYDLIQAGLVEKVGGESE
jgi:hypothetical protein